MTDTADADPKQQFARAFGDALRRYFEARGVGSTEAAKLLGLEDKNGKMRINSYFYDAATGKRTGAGAQILYLACTQLPRFRFEYGGYKISAVKLNGRGSSKDPAGQMSFSFHRQFDLAKDAGNVDVLVKRPNGRIELFVSLDAKAS
jgi:hypothetical protein